MYYGRIALRHLLHTYLSLKWVKLHVNQNDLTPRKVVNFFVQWIDTDNLYPDAEVEKKVSVYTIQKETDQT